jgi:hypothetical protein
MVFGDLLKFFPLAFWVVGKTGARAHVPFARLPLETVGLDTITTVRVSLRHVPSAEWPERAMGNEIIVIADNRTYLSVPKRWQAT